MKIIYNKIIPFKGFLTINLFGIIFARKPLNQYVVNHEKIHTAQMKELAYIFFYILYVLEWFIKLFIYRSNKKAYRNISFEKEAYKNMYNLEYLKTRKHYSWI